MKIGRLRAIFKLPQVLSHFQLAPRNWSKDHLAYVEWYKVGKAGANHNMIKVGKHVENANSITPGAIVPLRAIRQSCHLIPLTALIFHGLQVGDQIMCWIYLLSFCLIIGLANLLVRRCGNSTTSSRSIYDDM